MKLYIKQKIINPESLQEVLENTEQEYEQASLYNSKKKSHVDKDVRSTWVKNIKFQDYPEIEHALATLIGILDDQKDPMDYHMLEMQVLKYGKGDHFKYHRDIIIKDDKHEKTLGRRAYSASTILYQSEDLQGGEFDIWTKDKEGSVKHRVPLEVGETILFDSYTYHQVNQVKQGTRISLVTWLYLRNKYTDEARYRVDI